MFLGFFIRMEAFMKKFRMKQLTLIAMLGAISAILMVYRFALPLLPPFLSFDFSAIPELIGGFALGPLASIFIIIVKIVIQMVISGTNSMFTGEIQNFLLSCALVLPAVILYHRKKNKKEALLGMVVGVIVCTIVAVITNLYLIIPFYTQLYGLSMDKIVEMCQTVNPAMNSVNSMILLGIIPFNLIKCVLNCCITLLVYKKISPVMHRFADQKERSV